MRRRGRVEIRQMEIDDIPAVYRLGEQLFTSEELPILYRTWDPYEVTEYFTSDPDFCVVAERDDEVVGFILATTIEKGGRGWNKYGYIAWMGIATPYQNTGLGRRLYKEAEERLRKDGVRMIIADTEGDNARAIGFFNALGFIPRGQHVWLAKTLRGKSKRPAPTVSNGLNKGRSPELDSV